MSELINQRATDPTQYDKDEILWAQEGNGLNHIRRLFMEHLTPYLEDSQGKYALDVGCGQGWLVNELTARGAHALGIDPSKKNVEAAQAQYPNSDFEQSDLESFKSAVKFDLITGLMVFEHFEDLEVSFAAMKSLLGQRGELVLITGDFDKFTKPRHGYTVETQQLANGEVATRTDYGERAGVIYDINRPVERFVAAAALADLTLKTHQPISASDWLLKEQPRYKVHNGEPLFHLLQFES